MSTIGGKGAKRSAHAENRWADESRVGTLRFAPPYTVPVKRHPKPALPVLLFSQRFGNTSSRPRNSERNKAILAAGLEAFVTDAPLMADGLLLTSCTARSRARLASSSISQNSSSGGRRAWRGAPRLRPGPMFISARRVP